VTGPAGPSDLDLDQVTRVWPAVLDKLHQTAPALAAAFDGARPVGVDVDERTVTIGFPAAHTFNKRKAEAKDKREQLTDALESVLGKKLNPLYEVLDDGTKDDGSTRAEVDQAALVERLKSEFDAEEVS